MFPLQYSSVLNTRLCMSVYLSVCLCKWCQRGHGIVLLNSAVLCVLCNIQRHPRVGNMTCFFLQKVH